MDIQLGTLLPVRFLPPAQSCKYDIQVVVNWLQIEVDIATVKKLLVLQKLSHWRNKEVYDYVRTHDYTARMYG